MKTNVNLCIRPPVIPLLTVLTSPLRAGSVCFATALLLVLALILGCRPIKDCAPQAMARLSRTFQLKPSTDAQTLARMMRTGPDGTLLALVPQTWERLYPERPLVAIYSTLPDTRIDVGHAVDFTQTYLWFGRHEQGDHAVLMHFTSKAVVLSHSQFIPGTTNYLEETRDYPWLLTNTYFLYRVANKGEHPVLRPVAELSQEEHEVQKRTSPAPSRGAVPRKREWAQTFAATNCGR